MQEALNLHDARDRAETGRALLEGPHLLAEALAAGMRVERVFALAEDAASAEAARRCGAELVLVDERGLRRLATTEHPQSPVAVMVIPPGAVPAAGHLLVAWGVGDPGNVGTLIRSAAAFGTGLRRRAGHGRSLGAQGAARRRRGALPGRGGAGGGPGGPAHRGAPPGGHGGARREAALGPAPGPLAILVGDEARGLPAEVVAGCDLAVTIPMPGGTESLNAAVAGAIVAYEVAARGAPSARSAPRGG